MATYQRCLTLPTHGAVSYGAPCWASTVPSPRLRSCPAQPPRLPAAASPLPSSPSCHCLLSHTNSVGTPYPTAGAMDSATSTSDLATDAPFLFELGGLGRCPTHLGEVPPLPSLPPFHPAAPLLAGSGQGGPRSWQRHLYSFGHQASPRCCGTLVSGERESPSATVFAAGRLCHGPLGWRQGGRTKKEQRRCFFGRRPRVGATWRPELVSKDVYVLKKNSYSFKLGVYSI